MLKRADGLYVHPGRPDHGADEYDYDVPSVVVVDNYDGGVIEEGRKIKLLGGWTLRQYRNPTPCGAHYILTPDPGASYQWESRV